MKKALVVAMLGAGIALASTQAKAHDPVAGAIVGGAIGAAAGGPVGAAIGAVIGTAISSEHHYYRRERAREFVHRRLHGPHDGYRDPGYYERHRYDREPVREYREPARYYDRGEAAARYTEARNYREPPRYSREYREEPRHYRDEPGYYREQPRYYYRDEPRRYY